MKYSDASKIHATHRTTVRNGRKEIIRGIPQIRINNEGFNLDGFTRENLKSQFRQATVDRGISFKKASATITKSADGYTARITLGRKIRFDKDVTGPSLEIAFQDAMTKALTSKVRTQREKFSRAASTTGSRGIIWQAVEPPEQEIQDVLGDGRANRLLQPDPETVKAFWLAGYRMPQRDL